jgi:hypothetical protein
MRKTFKDFMAIAERYYEPNERLSSGKTPVEKAKQKSKTRAKTIATQSPQNQDRWAKQYDLTRTKVTHGADNKNYNTNVSHQDKDKVEIDSDKKTLQVSHPESGITYEVERKGDGRHEVAWSHSGNKHRMNTTQRIRTARNAEKVWNQHVVHRLPHGDIVHNTPVSSFDDRGEEKPINRRAELYKKRGGFGEVDAEGDQFGKVGRNPSPKQAKKGAKRIKPLDPEKAKDQLNWDS